MGIILMIGGKKMNFFIEKQNLLFNKRWLKFTYIILVITISILIFDKNTRISDLNDDLGKIKSNKVIEKLEKNYSILFSNLFGGNSTDRSESVIVDNNNDIIITGFTASENFPTLNAYDNDLNGDSDVFIVKFSNSGELLWSTYFGGEKADSGYAVAIDSSNNIILTGSTTSSDFPTLNAFNSTFNMGGDAFVSKFSSSGSLLWSTFIGGDYYEQADALVVDSSDNVIITGVTFSANFPTLNAFDNTYNNFTDTFVTKFSKNGSLIWSTYLGGFLTDIAYSLAVDSLDNIIIAGKTISYNFTTLNAYDNSYNGEDDTFITKLSSNCTLLWSTYLGGSDEDRGYAIAVDSSDNIVVTGETISIDFPTMNAHDNTYNGSYDAFITKFSSDGSLVWSTYLGGSGWESGNDIAITSSDNILVLCKNGICIFFSSNGTLESDNYLGENIENIGNDLVIDNEGNIISVGSTNSESEFPVANKDYNYSNSPSAICFLIKFKLSNNDSSSTDETNLSTPSFEIWNIMISIVVISSINSYRKKKR